MSLADKTDAEIQNLIDEAFEDGYLDCIADVAQWTDTEYAVWSDRLVAPMRRRRAGYKKGGKDATQGQIEQG